MKHAMLTLAEERSSRICMLHLNSLKASFTNPNPIKKETIKLIVFDVICCFSSVKPGKGIP